MNTLGYAVLLDTLSSFQAFRVWFEAILIIVTGIWFGVGVLKVVKAYNNDENDAQKKLINVGIAGIIFFGYTIFLADLEAMFQ